MDKLPEDRLRQQLREDAASINVAISAELDDRIRASLEGVTPERPRDRAALSPPRSMWWASSLTGIAAAAAIILLLNLTETPTPEPALPSTAFVPTVMPNLNLRNAVSTQPLRQELADLEADLKLAEEIVRKEIGIFP
jgi:hypothetical protein